MKILVTGIGGPTPRSIAIRLKEINPDIEIIGVDIKERAIGFYIDSLSDKKYIVPRADDRKYWEIMTDLVFQEKIDFAFVQPELEVLEWGKYYKKNGSYICPVLIPPLEFTENLMDKAAMANLLNDSDYIPKTVTLSPDKPDFDKIEHEVGYPCWIRASVGSGGLGSLKIVRRDDLKAWLFIHRGIKEFTVSEFLTGRHLANQMLYLDGVCIKNAGLECAEYVMADIAPSKITGNTSYGIFINENHLLKFCEEVMEYIANKLSVKPHGVFSFDLKEDSKGNLKVTEVNIRHMAYTGIMGKVGFDLINDTLHYLGGNKELIKRGDHTYDSDYIFLRDVDIEPILMNKSAIINDF
ncbi:hypothetical protein BH23BAC3_BH23BAC3_08090 [soil metagenome]